jgi:hypothetical protein
MTNTIWVLTHTDHGVDTYSGDTDPLTIPTVEEELEWLEGGYEDERDQFKADVASAIKRGHGHAEIEERFTLELKPLL